MAAPIHGLLAAFESPEALLAAIERVQQRGLTAVEAYTPYPVAHLPERLNLKRSRIPLFALAGGIIGGGGILSLQLYSTLVNYPVNVGSRPLASWTPFAVPTFECIILGAALVCFFGMIIGNGLPRLHHPIFNAATFSFANEDRFYLLVRAEDPEFDSGKVRRLLQSVGALSIEAVPE